MAIATITAIVLQTHVNGGLQNSSLRSLPRYLEDKEHAFRGYFLVERGHVAAQSIHDPSKGRSVVESH